MNEQPIVVGVDGSDHSIAAAGQAATIATLRGAPLVLVHGYLHAGGYGSAPLEPYVGYVPGPPEAGETMLAEIAAQLQNDHPALAIHHQQILGGGAATLIEESRRAQLLVVGSRGHGGFAGLLLGSVSAQVVAHAHAPVLVVRPVESAEVATEAAVVVGVDGSAGSTAALQHAAAEADRRKAPLVVISAGVEDTDEGRQQAEPLLAEAVHEARTLHPDLSVQGRIVHQDAGRALVEASGQAALVVVGSRGRGGFTGLLLGSVSQALVHHARCPVMVIPPKARDV